VSRARGASVVAGDLNPRSSTSCPPCIVFSPPGLLVVARHAGLARAWPWQRFALLDADECSSPDLTTGDAGFT
jgi:hypothetical protein